MARALPAGHVAALSGTRTYERRQPEQTVLYRTIAAHLPTFLARTAGEDGLVPAGSQYLGVGADVGLRRGRVLQPDAPLPSFVLIAGQAIPAPDGELSISPASGVLAPGQAFDLVLTVQTAGQTVVGAAATFDGVDITEALTSCLAAHVGPFTLGTPGAAIRCPGLNGSLLGPGTHTLAVTLTLGDGRTLTDSVVWEVPGAGLAAAEPRLAVSPPGGPLAQNQAFDLIVFVDPAGHDIVGGRITFDDEDVTAPLAACLVSSRLPGSQLVLRCPGLLAGLLGLGLHVLRVNLSLRDGSSVQGGAVWEILATAGGSAEARAAPYGMSWRPRTADPSSRPRGRTEARGRRKPMANEGEGHDRATFILGLDRDQRGRITGVIERVHTGERARVGALAEVGDILAPILARAEPGPARDR